MSNIFKREQRGEDRRYKSNSNTNTIYNFRGSKEKKVVPVELTDLDFPELAPSCYHDESSVNTLNFKDATLKESETSEIDKNFIPDGWVVYSVNDDGRVIHAGNKECNDEITPEEFRQNAIAAIDTVITRWSNYRLTYDELHGDGEYDIMYGSLYSEMLHSDFDEDFYDEAA